MLCMSITLLILTTGALCSPANPAVEHEHPVQKRATICYGPLGCFSSDAPFYSSVRPISFLPESPAVIDPKFLLYTRQTFPHSLRLTAGDGTTLGSSTFSASRPTKFVVHGFIDNRLIGSWMQTIASEFLKHGDYNVFIVDWGHGSLSLYGQATSNTRVVGAMIAQLITYLQNTTGARPEDMHIIGHSLGAQIAGYAGERLQHLGRITGLDPAGPYFERTDKTVRLDPSDALFVDVIHTDSGSFFSDGLCIYSGVHQNLVFSEGNKRIRQQTGFGMSYPCGHIDFFVNGGRNQPGCDQNPVQHIMHNGIIEGIREAVACNHMRAYHLFVESINSQCPFEAYQCNSVEDFDAGRCLPCHGEDCGFLGLGATQMKPTGTPATKKYYLKTGSSSPYCRYHYKLTLHIAQPGSAGPERGLMFIKLTGDGSTSEEIQLTPENIYIQPTDSYTYLVTSTLALGQIRDVTFRWVHESALLDIWSWNPLGLRKPTVYIDRVDVFSGEANSPKAYCANAVAVVNRQPTVISGHC